MKPRDLVGRYSPTFYLAFLACFLFFSSLNLLITPLPIYIEKIGGGPIEVGLAGTTFAISAIVLRPLMGRLIDARGSKLALIIGGVIFTIGPLSYILATTLPVFHLARAFHGIGIAAFTAAYYVLVADITPPTRWGEALGLAGIAPSFSMILATPAGTVLLEHTSHRLVFVLAAFMALASLVVTLLIREPSRAVVASQKADASESGMLDVVRIRGVVMPSLVLLTLGLSYGTVYAFLPLFARDRDLGNVGFFFTGLSLSIVASRSIAGRLSDRVGRLPVILPMCALLALSFVGLKWTYTFGVLIAMAVAHGLGFGGSRVGLETMVADSAPARARGRAFSIVYFCFDTGIAASGLLSGPVIHVAGYGTAFLMVGGIGFLTVALFAAAMGKQAPA
jgi:MFS family permease